MDFVFFAIHFCVFWSFCYIRHFFADYLYNLPKNIFITTTNINDFSNFSPTTSFESIPFFLRQQMRYVTIIPSPECV